ncbi:MAG: NAD-dependent epimerase/dehydratase family protein, partial [Mesorhizobium sp.]
LSDGEPVLVIDNLSRAGVEQNLEWLAQKHGSDLRVETVDVRDQARLASVLTPARAIFHLAAQTAVTTSLIDPAEDLDINLKGTFNVLEAARQVSAPVIFASTNKVYGSLPQLAVQETDDRY